MIDASAFSWNVHEATLTGDPQPSTMFVSGEKQIQAFIRTPTHIEFEIYTVLAERV